MPYFTLNERSSGTHRLGSSVDYEADLDTTEKRILYSTSQKSKPDSLVIQPVTKLLDLIILQIFSV
jgi:hypothetical protein